MGRGWWGTLSEQVYLVYLAMVGEKEKVFSLEVIYSHLGQLLKSKRYLKMGSPRLGNSLI